VENAVLDGVQVASEVCASPPPGAIADEKQLDLPLGIGLDVWMDFGVWLLMEVFAFPDNYGGM
jgi:hypothetical protein